MTIVILSVALALLAVVGGIWAMLFGMGVGEYLGGRKKSPLAVSKEELRTKVMNLNSLDLSFEIKPGQETDFILEWKIADAKWYGIFSKERLKKTYRAFILLDESRKSARYYEEMGEVEWHAGTDGLLKPSIRYREAFFKGRILFQKSYGVQYGLKENKTLGKVYEYKFDIGYARDPIKKIVQENGWEFIPVVRKNHALKD